MNPALALLKTLGQSPMMTRSLKQLERLDLSSNTWRHMAELVDAGLVFRLARGSYTAIPTGKPESWRPTVEVMAVALAVCRYGQGTLVGLSAARHWMAAPRSGHATVAIPARPTTPTVAIDRGAATLVHRDPVTIDARQQEGPLGSMWVASPAQTIIDLMDTPGNQNVIAQLAGRVDRPGLLMLEQHGASKTIRQTARRLVRQREVSAH